MIKPQSKENLLSSASEADAPRLTPEPGCQFFFNRGRARPGMSAGVDAHGFPSTAFNSRVTGCESGDDLESPAQSAIPPPRSMARSQSR